MTPPPTTTVDLVGSYRLPDGDFLVDLDGIAAATGYSRKTLEAFIRGARRAEAPAWPEAEVVWNEGGRSVSCWLLSIAKRWLDDTAPRVGPRGRPHSPTDA